MGTVNLSGSVPVTVEYDPDTKTVVRVIVHDDEHEWGLALDETEQAYQEIADGLEWPAWSFGY